MFHRTQKKSVKLRNQSQVKWISRIISKYSVSTILCNYYKVKVFDAQVTLWHGGFSNYGSRQVEILDTIPLAKIGECDKFTLEEVDKLITVDYWIGA